MKTPRAMLLMLTGLAGGIGVRLAFTLPAEDGAARRGGRAVQKPAPLETGPVTEKPGPRPDDAAVLTAHGGSRLRLLLAWLPGAGEDELLRMADALTSPPQDENLSIRLLMARWAEVNPAAMLAWARTQRGENYGSGFYVSNAIESWARVDFDGAWSAACHGLPATKTAALLGLTVMNPGKCLDLLRADPSLMDSGDSWTTDPFGSGFTGMEKVLKRLAAKEPAAVAALLDSGPAARMHRFADSIALAWAKSDPAAAVAWMQRLDPGVRAASLEEAAKWIAGHAPEQLPALLESLPAGRIRSVAAAEGFSRLASTDPAAARRQLDAMPASPSRQFCRGLLMKELLRTGDEAGAIALASQIGWQLQAEWSPATEQTVARNMTTLNGGNDASEAIESALQKLMGRVIARSPQEAAALLAKSGSISEILTEENISNHAALASALLAQGNEDAATNCQTVIKVWAASDPAAAAAWVTGNVHSSKERSVMMDNVLMKWAADPPAMLEWAAQMDAGTLRDAWTMTANADFQYTMNHVEQYMAAADTQACEYLLSRASFGDGDVSRILRLMPDDMEVSIQQPMQFWLNEQPDEAIAWASELPAGLRRTQASAGIVTHLNDAGDHAGAFAWAATLPAEARAEILTQALEPWGRADPDAAEAAIRASALPPEEQQQLLDSLPPP